MTNSHQSCSADSTRLELAIEQLLFSKITSGRLVGYTVTVAHEIMGLIRNIGTGDDAQSSQVKPIAWRYMTAHGHWAFLDQTWEPTDPHIYDHLEPVYATHPPAVQPLPYAEIRALCHEVFPSGSSYDLRLDRILGGAGADAQGTLNRRLGIGLLWTVRSALDEALGDSDVTSIEDDSELRERHPVQWAAQRLSEAMDLLEADQPPAAPVETGGTREALDNSQSLLAMISHLGADEVGHGIMPYVWEGEGLSKLIAEQITENRAALDEPHSRLSAGNEAPPECRLLIDALDALEAIDSEIVLTGHLKELADCALAARNADFRGAPQQIEVPTREQILEAFETIRLQLINCLEEPERTAFWLAVKMRNTLTPPLSRPHLARGE